MSVEATPGQREPDRTDTIDVATATDVAAASVPRTEAETNILLITYQIERADEQNTANLILGVTVALLTYALVLAPLLSTLRRNDWPDWLVLGTALPVWILSGMIIFQTAASDLRQKYIVHLEALIADDGHGGLRSFPRYTTMQRKLHIAGGWRKAPHVLLTVVTASTPLLASLGFTGFVMFKVAKKVGSSPQVTTSYWITYVVLFFLCAYVFASIGLAKGRSAELNKAATQLLLKNRTWPPAE